jgi:putative hydrolase of the HAD superfamily
MLKNIILDMGNVLLHFDPEIPLNRFCRTEEAKAVIRRELFLGPEWVQGDYGLITNEERFTPVSKRVPAAFHRELAQCVSSWDICMQPIAGAKEFCEYVRRLGCGLYVLSNADNTFYHYFPRFADISYFDGVMVSSDVHMIKPEKRIYEHFLKTYGLHPPECLFIDDRPENVAGAEAVGIHGHIYTGSFEPAKAILLQDMKQNTKNQ